MNDSIPLGNLNQCSHLDILKGTGKLGVWIEFLSRWRNVQTASLLDQISLVSRKSFRHFRLSKCHCHESNQCTKAKAAPVTVWAWDGVGRGSTDRSWTAPPRYRAPVREQSSLSISRALSKVIWISQSSTQQPGIKKEKGMFQCHNTFQSNSKNIQNGKTSKPDVRPHVEWHATPSHPQLLFRLNWAECNPFPQMMLVWDLKVINYIGSFKWCTMPHGSVQYSEGSKFRND